jgi:hypothetical protein
MNSFQKRVEIIQEEIVRAIKQRIASEGVQSEINSNKSIKVNFDANFGHTIKEVQVEHLIDERGMYYDYYVLDILELSELADSINA